MSLFDRLLDATVALSFDRTGFARHARAFAADLPAGGLEGKVCLVTGANAGLGLATARALLARCARVHLLCRDPARGRAALEALQRELPSADAHLSLLDVSDLDDVRRFAADEAPARIDVLVHNAGLLPQERRLTPQGLELTFATHVAGPHLLTHLLRAHLLAAGRPRVIVVSSGGMYTQRLDAADLDWAARRYDGVRAYAQTKRMQVVWAEELAAREPGFFVASMHPGWADTGGVRRSLPGFHRITRAILRTPEQGADTIVWLAARREEPGPSGLFWFDRAPRRTVLWPGTRESAADRAAFHARLADATGVPAGATR